MLKIATSDVSFSFNNAMLTQHDCINMGSPLGPILANTSMGFLESKIIFKVQDRINYFEYVDNCFVAEKKERFVAEFL